MRTEVSNTWDAKTPRTARTAAINPEMQPHPIDDGNMCMLYLLQMTN